VTDAPEKIWVEPDLNVHTNPASEDWGSGSWYSPHYKSPTSTEYVRADLYAEVQAKLDALEHDPKCVKCGHPKSNHPYRHPFQEIQGNP